MTSGSKTYSYTYNMEGVRVSKTENGRLHEYVVSGTTILREQVYTVSGTTKTLAYTLYYFYDESGSIDYVTVKSGTTSGTYYYVKNLQGDVVAVTDYSGNVIVRYAYDAWGVCTKTASALLGKLLAVLHFLWLPMRWGK